MAVLVDTYLHLKMLEELVSTLKKKQEKGVAVTISLNDTKDAYEQNVSSYVKQTKEQREQKANRYYLFNGKVVWQNDKALEVIQYKAKNSVPTSKEEDYPF
jgi:hypothetical protein